VCYIFYNAHIICCSVSQHDEDSYRMDKQGKLVLICNTQFHPDLQLSNRRGTEKDIEAIKKVFQGILGFKVFEFKDKDPNAMLQIIAKGLWQISV